MALTFRSAAAVAALLAGAWTSSHSAHAAVSVLGGQMAESCYKHAIDAADRGRLDYDAIKTCTLALAAEPLNTHDFAGTHVNRGVLELVRGHYWDAKRDFDTGVKLMPELGEAWTNRGAAQVALQQWQDGIADIDRGLALNAEEPEKAYFNRALAYEGLGDLKQAYLDFKKASELKPDWDQPRQEMARFTLTPTAGS